MQTKKYWISLWLIIKNLMGSTIRKKYLGATTMTQQDWRPPGTY